jgi:3',5'-cyclic AMP phosphodiesterase CpdA
MRIAHFSDLHLLSLRGVPIRRFFNKRATGIANLKFKRQAIHRPAYVRAIAREVKLLDVDHVIVTGDLTNLALEPEFEVVRELFEKDLGMSPRDVSIVPGNHDVYTRGSYVTQRFATYFADYLVSDLPELAVDVGAGRFPVVKLRGPVAVIGLCSAVPRLPFVAAGRLGREQLDALRRVLGHTEVQKRTPVVALHHPPHNPSSRWKSMLEGLSDAALLWSTLDRVPAGIVLHGHLHKRVRREDETVAGRVTSVGATSASLHHESKDRMAGFNVYEIANDGVIGTMEAHILGSGDRFEVRPLALPSRGTDLGLRAPHQEAGPH